MDNHTLITGIMPTRGRPAMAAAALECWRRQTWPDKELVIMDDADLPAFPEWSRKALEVGLVPDDGQPLTGDDRIRYFCLPGKITIGEKRNAACAMAYGEFIFHLDSDDWSAAVRLADQMEHMHPGVAVVGYHSMLWTDGTGWWRYDGPLFDGAYGALGTSFLYRKPWWETHHFPRGPVNRTDAEDNPFVQASMKAGVFVGVPAREMMVARVHPDNTSPKSTGGFRWKHIQDACEVRRFQEMIAI